MEIKSVAPKPYDKSIPPGISFEVSLSHIKYQEAIISVGGWLETDEKKIIANLIEVPERKLTSTEIGAKESVFDSQFKEETYKTTVIAPLDKKGLNYLENRRMKNRKGDLHLNLILNVKSIESKASVSHLHRVSSKEIGLQPPKVSRRSGGLTEGEIIVYAYDREFSPGASNQWILSGNGSPVFLATKVQILRKENIRIPSTDWIHDYAPKLGLGEYFIVEIPKGEKIIEKAWNYVEKAEECFRRWDTKGVFANCRETGSLLDELVKKKFRKNSFIYGERWGRTYSRFENFASLDLHIEDIRKSQKYALEDIKISKADAEHILIVTKALIKLAEELLKES
jgi:hypothetical protein